MTHWFEKINIYRFKRVTFGLKCSPGLIAATIKTYVELFNNNLASKILENIYVDNIILSANNITEAQHKCIKAKNHFAKAAMNLCEYTSNKHETLEFISEKDQLSSTNLKVLSIK